MRLRTKFLLCCIILLFFCLIFSKKQYAANSLKFYNSLIPNTKVATVAINYKNKRSLTVQEVQFLNGGIKKIYSKNNVDLLVSNYYHDKFCTNNKILIEGDIYTSVLFGDVNGDGITCDIDDIVMVINSYLGKKNLSSIQKLAANLQNYDNKLDIDDIMIMLNTYLGKDVGVPKKNITGDVKIGVEKSGICPLSEVVKAGDVIEWGYAPINLPSTTWIVWKNDGKNVSIIPSYNWGEGLKSHHTKYCDIFEQSSLTHYKGYASDYGKDFEWFIGRVSFMFKKGIVKEVRYPTLIEYNNFKNSSDYNIKKVFDKYLNVNFAVLDRVNLKRVPVSNIQEEVESNTIPIRSVYVLESNVMAIKYWDNGYWTIFEE